MELRQAKRVPRRLKVTFGDPASLQSGFTQNISETGLFVTANRLPPLGTSLVVSLEAPARALRIDGRVVRHAVVPPELRAVRHPGFGLHVTNREALRAVLGVASPAPRPPFLATFRSVDAWAKARQEQLAHGGLSFTASRALRFEEIVSVFVEWSSTGLSAPVRVRVVHCHPEGAGFVAVGLLVDPEALAELDRHAAAASAAK